MLEVPGYDLDMEWEKYGVMNWHIAHRSYFTSTSISNILNKSGFEVISIEKSLTEGISLNNLRVYARVSEEANNKKIMVNENFGKEFKLKSNKNKFSIIFGGYPRALMSNFKAIFKLVIV